MEVWEPMGRGYSEMINPSRRGWWFGPEGIWPDSGSVWEAEPMGHADIFGAWVGSRGVERGMRPNCALCSWGP